MHATVQPKEIGSVYRAATWEVVCRWAPHWVLSITAGLSNATTLQRRITTTAHENCMHVEQIIIIFYIFYVFFCSMYLVLFSIVLYRTIVTVYTDNIFLYNYLRQMHQIIHLSPVGCFTTARGKTVHKNLEVSWVNDTISVWKPHGHWFKFAVAGNHMVIGSNLLWHQRFFRMSLSLRNVFIFKYILQHTSYL